MFATFGCVVFGAVVLGLAAKLVGQRYELYAAGGAVLTFGMTLLPPV